MNKHWKHFAKLKMKNPCTKSTNEYTVSFGGDENMIVMIDV